MLILSRKCNEQIVIGENIVVTVVAIRGGNVRLGIDAPKDVTVHREEVFRAIQAGKASSSGSARPTGFSHWRGVAEGLIQAFCRTRSRERTGSFFADSFFISGAQARTVPTLLEVSFKRLLCDSFGLSGQPLSSVCRMASRREWLSYVSFRPGGVPCWFSVASKARASSSTIVSR